MNLRLPKWALDLLFVLVLFAVYILGSIYVLPRFGIET